MSFVVDPQFSRRRRTDLLFRFVCGSTTIAGIAALVSIVGKLAADGLPRLSFSFLLSGLSHRPDETGVLPAIVGSLLVVTLTMLMAAPVGIAAALYLEEFSSPSSNGARLMRLATANLAGVPSIVYGLVGLAVFVRWLSLGPSIFAGALTLSLVVLPMVVIVTQEALRSVPNSYREAALAIGSSRWQTVRQQILPVARSGIWTGLLLAFSRAIGETAPLMVVGAAYYVTSLPKGLGDSYTVLPMQIFNWSSDARRGFHSTAAAATLVLVGLLMVLNAIVLLRRGRRSQ